MKNFDAIEHCQLQPHIAVKYRRTTNMSIILIFAKTKASTAEQMLSCISVRNAKQGKVNLIARKLSEIFSTSRKQTKTLL